MTQVITPRPYKERRLYQFRCEICGTARRQSYKRSKAKKQKCRRCQKTAVDPNQQTLNFQTNGAEANVFTTNNVECAVSKNAAVDEGIVFSVGNAGG
jgi:ribosomal protein L28